MKTGYILPAMLALGIAVAPAVAAESVDETRPAAATARIDFTGVTGDFEIVGHDAGELAIAGELGDGVEELVIEGDENAWTVRLEMKENEGRNWFSGGSDSDLVIRVPHAAIVSASVVSGDLSLRGLDGERVDVRSVSGDVTVRDSAPERLSGQTVSGDLNIASGGLDTTDLQAVSGDIEASGLLGRVAVDAVSGDIDIEGSDIVSFEAETVSGDVEARIRPTETASIRLDSHSGTVNLALPAGTPLDFQGQTFSGGFSSDFDADTENVGEKGRNQKGLSIRQGAGTVKVRANTFSGEVRLSTLGG
ncbi:MAG: DUF4097 family beta strand repeat-containing protein [Wenzhouxiangellaceae bacterium]|nr:DUF4097 family beta strand repeat-containing protein [Wenzhouxiangellaceae bacterium]